MATISSIKSELGINVLNLNRAKTTNEEGNLVESNWFRHWDNEDRVAVSIHEDTMHFGIDNPDADVFQLQGPETRTSKNGGEYTAYRIVKYGEFNL